MTTHLKAAALVLALGTSMPAFAEDAHHPQGAAQGEPAPTQPSGQPMRSGMGMMGMMGQGGMMGGDMMGQGGMSGMMPMMGMMQLMRGGAHIEGRLAFLKAELKIAPAQEKAWDEFASAVRQAASKMRDANAAMPAMSGMAESATPPLLLEQHEKQLTAQLEAIRIVKPALGPFYAGLSEEQKKTFAQLHPILHGML